MMLQSWSRSAQRWRSPSALALQASLNRSPRPISRSRYGTAANITATPKIGDKIHGFTVRATKDVPELHLTAVRLQHDRTGADYFHVARDDSNNVFAIGFKTNPPDDTGVPHILEHTTLCGSKKYPVRDPFFKMLPRSLSTFMNAFTSADHTTYPFSTTNKQDFKNLMSVYLDATLNPLLKQEDFAQEGWRLGVSDKIGDPQNLTNNFAKGASSANELPVVFKGVVYNEMKGMMSDASYVFHVRWNDHIFPAIHNSGGDPQKITDLTYENLKDFHAQNYHPSNAKIFTYGNIPLEDHLLQVGQALGQFKRKEIGLDVKSPIDLENGPVMVTVPGPVDSMTDSQKQHKTSITWRTGDTSDVQENFALSIISSLLLDGYGSPAHKALIESELGSHFTPNTGFDLAGKRGTFSIGLGGVAEENVREVKNAITGVLEDTVFKGVDDGKVQGILHQLELSLKHKTAAFGMGMMQRLTPGWFNGADPSELVVWNDVVTEFKRKYQEEGYLENLVIKYFLNDRYLSFTMEPSPDYHAQINQEEATRLAQKWTEACQRSASPKTAIADTIDKEQKLIQIQDAGRTQDLSCLPSLKVEDISRTAIKRPVRLSTVNDVPVQWRETATNGLTYFKALHKLQQFPFDLRPWLPLYLDCLSRLGTEQQNMGELEDLMKLKTGGVSFSRHSSTSPLDLQQSQEGILYTGMALDGNVPSLLDLIQKLAVETDFYSDKSRALVRELLYSQISGVVDGIAGSGHAFARGDAAQWLTPKLFYDAIHSGLPQMLFLSESFLKDGKIPDDVLDNAMTNLRDIQALAIPRAPQLSVSLTCDPSAVSSNEKALSNFLETLPARLPDSEMVVPASPLHGSDLVKGCSHFWHMPYQVSYSALALETVPFTHPDTAPLAILGQLLTHKHLHHEVREKGGAYGAGASASLQDGFIAMTSYRDPNPSNSIQVARAAGEWATEQSWTDQDLAEAKLSLFQGLDAPISVDQEGDRQFLRGISDEMLQQLRENLLDVKAADVHRVANQYLVQGMKDANVSVVGPRTELIPAHGWRAIDMYKQPAEEQKKGLGLWDAIVTGAILSWFF